LTSSRDSVHQYAETVKVIADYVGQEYTHGGDIRFMIENLQDYNFIPPEDPPVGVSQYEVESWKKQLDMYWKRRGIYMDNKMKLFSLIWGQSSKTTQSKVETHLNFAACKNNYDSLGLLKILCEFVFKRDNRQYKYKAEDQAKRAYYNGGSLLDNMHLADELHFHPDVSANIISSHHLAKRFKSVKYNDRIKDAFIVTRDDDAMMEFVPSGEGLDHYNFNLSVKRRKELESLKKETAIMIQTVDGLKRNFWKEIENADKARRLYATIRRPLLKIFEEMIKRGKLFYANITTQDYRNALQVYVKDLGDIKGKTTRKNRIIYQLSCLPNRNQNN
jgi:hypothetical protein